MQADKFKYCKNRIQLSLVKAVLVCSIFSFSGFNLQVHAAVKDSVKTELTESRKRDIAYSLKKNTQKYSEIRHRGSLSNVNHFRSILNYNRCLKIKFKSYQNRILLYSIKSIRIHFKIPPLSSGGEAPLSES